MEPLVFSMSGTPRGQGRPRATARGGFAKVYKADKDRSYERSVGQIAKAAMGGAPPFEGPLSVSLRFRLQPPKSMTKRQRAAVLAGEEAYAGAYDIDNLVKSILDGCNKIAFADDKQVVRLFATKIAHERAGVDVRIEPLAPRVAA